MAKALPPRLILGKLLTVVIAQQWRREARLKTPAAGQRV
jgi:hypothetical protein